LLCREIVGGSAEWREHGVAIVPDGVAFGRTEAPVFVVVAWVPPRYTGDTETFLSEQALHAVGSWHARTDSAVVLTNVVAERIGDQEVSLIDARALSSVVAKDAQLRLRMPSLLGVCDDESIFPEQAVERSTADLDAAQELARVFVPTRAHRRALAALERHGFVVLTGPPEMGKTASARMIGLAKLSDGWEFHECIRPDQLWAAFDRDRPQVFVADDAFGSTEYRPEAAERWAVELDRILRAMDGRHWLVWTSRPAPLKAGLRRIQREHGVERFPRPGAVEIDAAALDETEKALILFRHARAAGLPSEPLHGIRAYGWDIVSHEHFTPERIRRFVRLYAVQNVKSAADVATLVDAGIREPTTAMAASFRALDPVHRAVLVALLDSPVGAVHDRDLAAAVRRHVDGAIGVRPEVLLDRLTDHFVRVGEAGTVTWVHPSWRDLVIEELAGERDERRRFLERASIDGLLLAVSTEGGVTGERALPLLLEDGDWDALANRLAELVPQLEEPDTVRLFEALESGLSTLGGSRVDELAALASYVLDLVARRWNRRHGPIPVGVLARWLRVRAWVREKPDLPDLTATWVESLPLASLDLTSYRDVADLRDWIGLVELLQAHAPSLLATFQFPDSVQAVVSDLAGRPARARSVAEPGLFLRLGALFPGLRDELETASLYTGERAPAEETYVPRELSPELEELLDAPPLFADTGEAVVRRVLRDL
jgi:conflict system STAND superfamily ATPase